MTDTLKGCPIPGCGGRGVQYGVKPGRLSTNYPVCCTNVGGDDYCRLANIALPLDVWQALSRPDSSVDTEGETREKCPCFSCDKCRPGSPDFIRRKGGCPEAPLAKCNAWAAWSANVRIEKLEDKTTRE